MHKHTHAPPPHPKLYCIVQFLCVCCAGRRSRPGGDADLALHVLEDEAVVEEVAAVLGRTRRLQTSCAYHMMGEATVDGPWVLSALMRAALA